MSNIPNRIPIILNDKQICYFKYSNIKLYSSYSEYIASILEIENKSNLCINIRVNPVIIDCFTVVEQKKIIHLSLFGLTKELTDLQMKNCNVYMLTSILLIIDYLCPKNKENFKWNKKIEKKIILEIRIDKNFDWLPLFTEISGMLPNLANKMIKRYTDGFLKYIENKDEFMKIIDSSPQVCCQIMFEMQQNLKYYRECRENNEHIIRKVKKEIVKIGNTREINKHYDVIYKNCEWSIDELDVLLDRFETDYY